MSHPVISRESIPWFPTINYKVCQSDLNCLIFCPHGVFEWDPGTGRPVVAHPYNCVPGCDSCQQRCTTGALTLPSKETIRAAVRRLRQTARGASPPAGSG